MKIQKKTAKLSLLAIVLAISFTLPIVAVTAKKEAWILDPVYIDELVPGYTWADWADEPWLKGSGTIEDPYMIKNVVINGEGSAFCMVIWNSDAYFKIMDSIFYNTKPPSFYDRNAGISMVNTQNGVIFKNQFLNNGWQGSGHGVGISLDGSDDNKIQKNIISNSAMSGIYIFENSDNNIIQKNIISDNGAAGISLENSDNNLIVDNYCNGNSWGILLNNAGTGSSDDNTITRNTCIENYETGIAVVGSNRNTLFKNLCQGNIWGISIGFGAWDNKVTQNDCNGNSMGGIVLSENSYINEIKGNDCYENQNGILLINNAIANKIEDNLCKNNEFGISVGAGAYNNEITENDIIENWGIGIVLWDYPWGNVVYHNNIIDNIQQAWDDNPWSNNWNENYWSDYPGTDFDGDGLGDTYLPWPIWPYFGWDGYDYTPFVEENGWEDDNLQEDVVHAFITNEQRLSTGIGVENSISEFNYLIVGSALTLGERRYFEFGPPYTWQVWLDGEEIELSSFWWDDKEGEKLGQPAFMRIYYHIFEPYSLQDLELGWHTLDFEFSYYAANGPYRYLVTGGWSSGFELVE